MNQLWVRISLTYVAITLFLFFIPAVVYLTIQAENINFEDPAAGLLVDEDSQMAASHTILARFISLERVEIANRLIRILLSISLVGILVGVIGSRGLAKPLHDMARAAQAVGSQDLSQRLVVKGSSEVREVAVAFNAMAEALEEADRQRSDMLADIAHELRTPLTVIQGNLRAILDDVYELDKVEVARLYDQTRQLSRLVDDLHDLALLEANEFSLNLSSLNLGDLAQNVVAIYRPIFEDQGIGLELHLPETLPAVQGDSARLTQCMNNLINNALRHTKEGGKITISLEQSENSQVIRVKDTGAGIEPQHLPFVFDRFYRVDPDRSRLTGGSGLGLAITRALVQAHGGEIAAASQGKNLGSEFTISIPC
jgi:signal transduction histidine kinase